MARPLVVRVGDLLREPGSRRSIDRTVDLGPLATSSASTIPGTDLELTGEVTAMAGGVEVVGTLRYDWYGSCRRCLDDVTGGGEVEVREIAQRDPVDEDVLPIDDDLLDLEELVRELVLSSLPLAPLCREDCPGPDPDRFPARTVDDVAVEDADAAASAPSGDPRWAALDALRFDEPSDADS